MNRQARIVLKIITVIIAYLSFNTVANAAVPKKIDTEQSKPLPRVLLIGDSICGGYQHGVKKLLADYDKNPRTLVNRKIAATPDKKTSITKKKVAEPLKLHPDNPHYFLFRGEPTILVTSGEHLTGRVDRTDVFEHAGGERKIVSLSFAEDMALRVKSVK